MISEEQKRKIFLEIHMENSFIISRNLEFMKHGYVDGESGSPKFFLNDYINYLIDKYIDAGCSSVNSIIENILLDILKYYDVIDKQCGSEMLKKKVSLKVWNDLMINQLRTPPNIRSIINIYNFNRYIITPFTKEVNTFGAHQSI